MIDAKTKNMRMVLAALGGSGIDRLYQQIGTETGVILTLHHVSPEAEPEFAPNTHLTIHPGFLQTVIELLRERDFEFVTMDEAHQRIETSQRGPRFAAITVDDGYRDFAEYGVPILEREEVPFALYIATGLIDGTGILWWRGIEQLIQLNDALEFDGTTGTLQFDCSTPAAKRNAFCHLEHHLTKVIPETELADVARAWCEKYGVDLDLLTNQAVMSWDELRELSANPYCTIGAHGVDHFALARLSSNEVMTELTSGADKIMSELGERPTHLAYPFGYRNAAAAREFSVAKDLGFKTAVTTRPGMIFHNHNKYLTALPRVSVNGWYQRPRYFKPLTTGLPTRLRQGFRRVDVG